MKKQLVGRLVAAVAGLALLYLLSPGPLLSAERSRRATNPPEDTAELLRHLDRFLEGPRAKLLILGTFHFDDGGLDDYKPKHALDVLSEDRQQEIGR
jgi:hypothetical protein